MTDLAVLQAQLATAKTELREEFERRALIDCAGPWAEQIFYETAPEADSIAGVSHHEAGHYVVSQLVGLSAAVIQVQLYADNRLQGTVFPTWELIDQHPTQTDGQNLGTRIQLCKTVGIQIDLDEVLARAGKMVRAGWPRIQRIGEHVASVCHAQNGNEWRVVVGAETIERLFWTPGQWTERYGSGICA